MDSFALSKVLDELRNKESSLLLGSKRQSIMEVQQQIERIFGVKPLSMMVVKEFFEEVKEGTKEDVGTFEGVLCDYPLAVCDEISEWLENKVIFVFSLMTDSKQLYAGSYTPSDDDDENIVKTIVLMEDDLARIYTSDSPDDWEEGSWNEILDNVYKDYKELFESIGIPEEFDSEEFSSLNSIALPDYDKDLKQWIAFLNETFPLIQIATIKQILNIPEDDDKDYYLDYQLFDAPAGPFSHDKDSLVDGGAVLIFTVPGSEMQYFTGQFRVERDSENDPYITVIFKGEGTASLHSTRYNDQHGTWAEVVEKAYEYSKKIIGEDLELLPELLPLKLPNEKDIVENWRGFILENLQMVKIATLNQVLMFPGLDDDGDEVDMSYNLFAAPIIGYYNKSDWPERNVLLGFSIPADKEQYNKGIFRIENNLENDSVISVFLCRGGKAILFFNNSGGNLEGSWKEIVSLAIEKQHEILGVKKTEEHEEGEE